ncbi:hypothetical protein BKA61DRAFT_595970 [Leptodontidium sp. MPI-SDFR-AT-0119]|nr:hypothetical protein BKA61DRAFT_595970 [Leptodontidium sp. MPI-SDFR-AT-0119]
MATEAAVRHRILSSASENSELLVKLAQTSEAPSILQAHLLHVSRLEESLKDQTTSLTNLKAQVDAKFKTHKNFRDSTTRRFFYRATKMQSKFEKKAMKEEREYFTALGAQSKAEERRAILQADYDAAVRAKEPLETATKEHGSVHERIDELYEKLFGGPTPGFGDEDEHENWFYGARGRNEEIKRGILAARRANAVLSVAQRYLKRGQNNLKTAQWQVEESFLFLDNALNSLHRTNEALRLAVEAVRKADEHLAPLSRDKELARQMLLAHFEAAKIQVERSYSRESILGAVAASQESLMEAEGRLNEMTQYTKDREQTGLSDIRVTARQLEDARQELQQIRQGVFERVAGFGEAAPAYNECCDRADSFCVVVDQGTHEHVNVVEELPELSVSSEQSAPPGYDYQRAGSTSPSSCC